MSLGSFNGRIFVLPNEVAVPFDHPEQFGIFRRGKLAPAWKDIVEIQSRRSDIVPIAGTICNEPLMILICAE